MIRGLYTASSGMVAQQRKQESISNNIANINTPGYKASESTLRSFPKMLLQLSRDNEFKNTDRKPFIGVMNTGVLAEENVLRFQQGDIQETTNPFDFALVDRIDVEGVTFGENGIARSTDGQVIHRPKAFFTVMNEQGEIRYTRAGKMLLNEGGELITTEGDRVMGIDGQPVVISDQSRVTITKNGQFLQSETGNPVVDAQGNPIPGMLLSKIDNPNQLIPEGLNKYRFNGDPTTVPGVEVQDSVEIHQGFVERSNVDTTRAMVDMITVARAYEANQKVIQTIDRNLDKTVNDIGRV